MSLFDFDAMGVTQLPLCPFFFMIFSPFSKAKMCLLPLSNQIPCTFSKALNLYYYYCFSFSNSMQIPQPHTKSITNPNNNIKLFNRN